MKRNLLAPCAGVPCSSLGITGDRSRGNGNDHLSGTSMGGETGESANGGCSQWGHFENNKQSMLPEAFVGPKFLEVRSDFEEPWSQVLRTLFFSQESRFCRRHPPSCKLLRTLFQTSKNFVLTSKNSVRASKHFGPHF